MNRVVSLLTTPFFDLAMTTAKVRQEVPRSAIEILDDNDGNRGKQLTGRLWTSPTGGRLGQDRSDGACGVTVRKPRSRFLLIQNESFRSPGWTEAYGTSPPTAPQL